jgi:hypothetical protein
MGVKISGLSTTTAQTFGDTDIFEVSVDNGAGGFVSKKITGSGMRASTITANRQTGTSYTLVLSDAGKLIESNNGSANTISIPLNSSVAFEIGTQLIIAQYGSGKTRIVGIGGVTVRSAGGKSYIENQYGMATIIKIATDEWYLSGALSTS